MFPRSVDLNPEFSGFSSKHTWHVLHANCRPKEDMREYIMTDMRKRQDWLEEQVSQLMDQMEVNPAGPEESEIL